jgi:hypothetical protein
VLGPVLYSEQAAKASASAGSDAAAACSEGGLPSGLGLVIRHVQVFF